jgi:hypothetical protein
MAGFRRFRESRAKAGAKVEPFRAGHQASGHRAPAGRRPIPGPPPLPTAKPFGCPGVLPNGDGARRGKDSLEAFRRAPPPRRAGAGLVAGLCPRRLGAIVGHQRPRPPRPVERTRDTRLASAGFSCGLGFGFGLRFGFGLTSALSFFRAMTYAAAIRTAAPVRSPPNTALSSIRTLPRFVVPLSASKRASCTGLA